ncbi:MAG: hypothetical protein IJM94_01855 [Clostridia bacterium]|nr:hypothetical protein [Clostridia bacterium]
MKTPFNLKELILGLLCGLGACAFIIGMIPNYQFISMLVGVGIACLGLYYVTKHKPATWFLTGFVIVCLFFTLLK